MKIRIVLSVLVALFMGVPASVWAKGSEALFPSDRDRLVHYTPVGVIHVIDGDTFRTIDGKVRLWGIDAPEKDEPLYNESRIALKSLMKGKKPTCKFIEMDRYGRDVMHCMVDGQDLGGLMVKHGYAKDYARFSAGFYAEEEAFAIAQKAGIWE